MSNEAELEIIKMLSKDNLDLKRAGDALAVAAIQVATEYDGIHRLRLAIANWSTAVANEGGRGERYLLPATEPQPWEPRR